MGTKLITLAEAKIFNQICDDKYDSLIVAYIPIVTDEIENYCKDDFIDLDTDEKNYPDGLKDPASMMIAFKIYNKNSGFNLSSYTIGSTSETYINGYPIEIYQLLDNYRKLEFY